MNKLIQPGRIIFAIGMIALGILSIVAHDFIVGRPPAWPADLNANPMLAYVSGGILILAALVILLGTYEVVGAITIAGLIFLLSGLRHIPNFMVDWGNAYKTFALIGGALIVAGSYHTGMMSNRSLRKGFVRVGTLLLTAFFLMGCYAHFKYAGFVMTLIPTYIPYALYWTYFAGACLFAGGIGMLIPKTRALAALLSGIMIAGWFALLHIPRLIANTGDLGERMGVLESFTFVGICFTLAAVFSRRD